MGRARRAVAGLEQDDAVMPDALQPLIELPCFLERPGFGARDIFRTVMIGMERGCKALLARKA
jgi:hypothetical protein